MKNKIVLVPFAFDGLSGSKLRPALCSSHEISFYEHIIICCLTSQIEKAIESFDVKILESDQIFEKQV